MNHTSSNQTILPSSPSKRIDHQHPTIRHSTNKYLSESTKNEFHNDKVQHSQNISNDEHIDADYRKIFYEELGAQLNISVPTMASFLLNKIPWLISLHFAGNLGSLELAAVSLASSICNVTGLSLSVGMSSAMTTLTGQARGDLLRQIESSTKVSDATNQNKHHDIEATALIEDHQTQFEEKTEKAYTYGSINQKETCEFSHKASDKHNSHDDEQLLMPLTYLYRGIFIQLLCVLPIGIWWLYGINPLLTQLGQDETVSKMASVYLKILTPGLLSYSLSFIMNTWLQSMDLAHIPAYSSIFGVVLHYPMNLLFVRVLNLGYIGVGLATILYQALQPVLACIYLFGTEKGRMEVEVKMAGQQLSFWREAYIAVSSLSGIWQYLSLALPGILVISEWWASETTIFLAGRLSPNALGAMAIYQSINTCCCMFPIGISIALSARVGTWLGKNEPYLASFSSKTGIMCAFILSVTLSCILHFTPHTYFPSFFSPDKDVILQTSLTIPYLALYVFADGLQVTYNGIMKACGRQIVTVPIVLIAYWVVGVPLAYRNAFVLHPSGGVEGLVSGMTVGTWVHFILIAGTVIWTTNWIEEAKHARKRLKLERK